MSTETSFGRGKSSLLTAGGFVVLFSLFFLVTAFIPVVNVLVQAAIFFGSPFMWLLIHLEGGQAAPSDGSYLMSLALWAPYPLYGALVGYFWPLKAAPVADVSRQIAHRFAIVLLLVGIGVAILYFEMLKVPSL